MQNHSNTQYYYFPALNLTSLILSVSLSLAHPICLTTFLQRSKSRWEIQVNPAPHTNPKKGVKIETFYHVRNVITEEEENDFPANANTIYFPDHLGTWALSVFFFSFLCP